MKIGCKMGLLALCLCGWVSYMSAGIYAGRVVDQNGQPIAYATVYPEIAPEWGTATNNDGYFSFEANLLGDMKIVFSFIGYEKKIIAARELADAAQLPTITLTEQPIALQETVVAAKPSKQKNKRKQMAALLHAVYVKLEEEFPDEPSLYRIVSDVRMDCASDLSTEIKNRDKDTWGMEQMIANVVVLPEQGKAGRDSVQFQGLFCKRFFDARKRAEADTILAGNLIERMDKKGTGAAQMMRKAVNAVDSGVVVHQALFALGNMRYDFEQSMTDTRHWTVSNESEGETVLTHTQTVSKYLGCFKLTFQRHYIVDSETFAVRRFSEHAEVKIVIPFGYKLNADQLQMLNLLNMGDSQIARFRLRRMNSVIDLNTIYQRQNGHVYTLEKNMIANSRILGRLANEGEKAHQDEIPFVLKATQRVTDLKTEGVKPLSASQITKRLERQIVEIY